MKRPLTDKEKEALFLICDGYMQKEIAFKLGVSQQAIKARVWRVKRKIGGRTHIHTAILFDRYMRKDGHE